MSVWIKKEFLSYISSVCYDELEFEEKLLSKDFKVKLVDKLPLIGEKDTVYYLSYDEKSTEYDEYYFLQDKGGIFSMSYAGHDDGDVVCIYDDLDNMKAYDEVLKDFETLEDINISNDEVKKLEEEIKKVEEEIKNDDAKKVTLNIDKKVLKAKESTKITAKLTEKKEPLANEKIAITINTNLIKGETDENGEFSTKYTAGGVGDVKVTAKAVGTEKAEDTIEDCLDYTTDFSKNKIEEITLPNQFILECDMKVTAGTNFSFAIGSMNPKNRIDGYKFGIRKYDNHQGYIDMISGSQTAPGVETDNFYSIGENKVQIIFTEKEIRYKTNQENELMVGHNNGIRCSNFFIEEKTPAEVSINNFRIKPFNIKGEEV